MADKKRPLIIKSQSDIDHVNIERILQHYDQQMTSLFSEIQSLQSQITALEARVSALE